MDNVFNHSKHKELWLWLAENPGNDKSVWPGWESVSGYDPEVFPDNECFACEYFQVSRGEEGRFHMISPEDCEKHCPLIWPSGQTCCDVGSLFREWCDASEDGKYERAKEIALIIANLPLRKGVKIE